MNDDIRGDESLHAAPDFQSPERVQLDNEESKIPPDEKVILRCLWVLEAYTPSSAAELGSTFEEFGWGDPHPSSSIPRPPEFIAQARTEPWGGSWLNAGYIHAPDVRGIMTFPHPATPQGFRAIHASINNVVPSLTVVTWQFMLSDDESRLFEEPLRRDLGVHYEDIPGGGRRRYMPSRERAHLVGALRVVDEMKRRGVSKEAMNAAMGWVKDSTIADEIYANPIDEQAVEDGEAAHSGIVSDLLSEGEDE